MRQKQNIMNRLFHMLAAAAAALLVTACSEDDTTFPVGGGVNGGGNGSGESTEQGADIPEGYFRVVFSSPDSRAPITGSDGGRVRDVRYLLFKSTGEFVKEKHIVTPSDPAQIWPISTVCDTLPKGNYRAVFLCNAEKTLFPIPGSPATPYADVLTGYQSGYANGRIVLPPVEFSTGTEYYMANVTFSNVNPTPVINMQRIIGMLDVHRNFVDAQTALNKLTANIFTNFHFKDQIKLQLYNTLPGILHGKLDKGPLNGVTYAGIVGGLDSLVSNLTRTLVTPLTDLVYNVVAAELVNQLGAVLTANTDQQGNLLGFLGVILNPWATSQADAAIVTMNDFPKSIDFDRTVKTKFDGLHKFKFKFTGGSVYDEKDILIRGFSGQFDLRKINVVKTGLIAGLVIDDIVDGPWLLNGTFIDINDQLQYSNGTNRRAKYNYSFLDLGLKSYDPQTQSPQPLSVTVNIASIPNLDGLVQGLPLLGGLLSSVINNIVLVPIKTLSVTVPVNFPLLGVQNLKLSGGWQESESDD